MSKVEALTDNQNELKNNMLHAANIGFNFINDMSRNIKRSDKKRFKSIGSDVDKRIKSMQNVRPSYADSKHNLVQGLFYVLDTSLINGCFITGMNERGNKDLEIWFRDKEFKIFYKKVLIVLTYIQENRENISLTDSELEAYTFFLSSKSGVLFMYFLNKEETITVEKVKSFLSKVLDWKSMILNFLTPLTDEQELILDEIKSGVKYVKLKNESSRNNPTYKQSQKYNVLEDMKNNIIIKYISGKDGKHFMHKLPVMHWRKGHWRYYKNGNKVWIEGKWVGGNEELNAA